jgi:DNA-binding CsgD family transcriptional regulator
VGTTPACDRSIQTRASPGSRTALIGRWSESAAIDRLIVGVREGRSGALVVTGDPGIGKTELLHYAIERATPDCHVAPVSGVESEMELAYAGLHQLCAPLVEHLNRLPGPQREALERAFGLAAGPAPDPFFVALAVLGLLSAAAAEQPLVCVVDDMQWLDHASAQALAFVARRLGMESVALVLAVREPGGELAGIPQLRLGPLREEDARALLRSATLGPLDPGVTERIVAETRGNPLALLELPHGLTPAQLAGGFAVPDGVPVPSRIEELYCRRVNQLREDARQLLVVAAAEPVGDRELLWRAAAALGIPPAAGSAAERAGLIDIGVRVRFRHPLVRSAVYQAATPGELREVHRALAAVTDPDADPDRRAWHRANAVTGPDETVAAELERSAGRADARGGKAAAAAFLERAAGLTRDPARRADRALQAAQAKLEAGAPDAALSLLALVDGAATDGLRRACAERLRGRIAFASNRGIDAARLLLAAARRFEALDARLARDTYLDALQAAMVACTLGDGLAHVARAARAAPGPPGPPTPADRLLDGIAVLFSDGHAAAAPLLRRVLAETPDETWARWPWFVAAIAWELWDVSSYRAIAARQVDRARQGGAVTALLPALSMMQIACVHAGDFGAAETLLEESDALATATATPQWPYARMVLAAWRGRESEAVWTIAAAVEDANERGEGLLIAFADLFTSILRNGLGDHRAALAAAGRAAARMEGGFVARALPELVEAAVHVGEPAIAADAFARMRDVMDPCPTPWAAGVEAYCRAMLAQGESADRWFRAAIGHLGNGAPPPHLARAHLLYGEWLRRERRRADAREHLRRALQLFAAMGAEAFAGRAERELRATGERARGRTATTGDALTAREAQIARLARDGLSNTEIGERLFISHRTVEYHLSKVFAKLDIMSRNQLAAVLERDPATAQPA